MDAATLQRSRVPIRVHSDAPDKLKVCAAARSLCRWCHARADDAGCEDRHAGVDRAHSLDDRHDRRVARDERRRRRRVALYRLSRALSRRHRRDARLALVALNDNEKRRGVSLLFGGRVVRVHKLEHEHGRVVFGAQRQRLLDEAATHEIAAIRLVWRATPRQNVAPRTASPGAPRWRSRSARASLTAAWLLSTSQNPSDACAQQRRQCGQRRRRLRDARAKQSRRQLRQREISAHKECVEKNTLSNQTKNNNAKRSR